ncbi:MAG: penicillin-binding protein [Alphaproteobacteria bacterium]|nr:penicillin-binding protein [Alphaproteobacteria bacterium]
MMRRLINWLTMLTFLFTSAGVAVFFLFFYYGRGLPDYDFLHNYEPIAVNQIQASNGQTLREFSQERRVYAPLDLIPSLVITAFLVAEDKNFFYHCGLDIQGIIRAIISNSTQGSWLSRPLGGSTITQQVAKNFLIGNERSFERKAKEAIMSLRLESALSKDRILELYLNQIYLGMGAYGVVAAALTYFNKTLDKLSIAEIAFLAAMPKAPSFYPNQKDLSRAKARRDWVIDRLQEEEILTEDEANVAKDEPLKISQGTEDKNQPDYYSEYIRQELTKHLGEDIVTQGGLTVKTTLVPALQEIAVKALKQGLIAYDRRHGWRGPIHHVDIDADNKNEWLTELQKTSSPPGLGDWSLAIVLETTPDKAKIGLKNDEIGFIPLEHLKWAKKNLPNQMIGPEITHPEDVLNPGDIIAVSHSTGEFYYLEQIPEVTGGLVALNPHTGHVVAMVGGYDFEKNQYNCAVQAKRQPGSAFKPFVYLTALEHGYTPETRVLDAPIMLKVGGKMGTYAPKNITHKFYGPTPLRSGLIHSRNVMTVRLAQQIGLRGIEKTARNFGLVEKLPHQLAMALGAAETTLLKLTAAYGMIANGGFQVPPIFIEEVMDRHNQTVYEAPTPSKTRIASARSIRHLTEMMVGVAKQGTARSLASLERPVAAKTGSTNEHKDALIVGFTPDLVAGVFVGFAKPRTLGSEETGARAALPIFKAFIAEAMKDKPVLEFKGF